jgi:pimeloyl-ACP methyl ester carboxylesterase
MKETAIRFGKFDTLIGVITEPETPAQDNRPIIILSNAGLIHRIGPNRIYVKLARLLAEDGYRVLRFDLSGVGDSLPRPDHMPVEQFTVDDVVQAMDQFMTNPGGQNFVLMGHCAGAYHSFRTAAQDQRVQGVVMMNPDGGEADWVEYDHQRKQARYFTNYYSKQALFDPHRWKRFFTGQINYRNVLSNIYNNVIKSRITGFIFQLRQRFGKRQISQADDKLFTVEAILQKLFQLDASVLLIYSENATSLERVQTTMGKELRQLNSAGKLTLTVIQGADHIFSPLTSQDALFLEIRQWLRKYF